MKEDVKDLECHNDFILCEWVPMSKGYNGNIVLPDNAKLYTQTRWLKVIAVGPKVKEKDRYPVGTLLVTTNFTVAAEYGGVKVAFVKEEGVAYSRRPLDAEYVEDGGASADKAPAAPPG